MRPIALFLLFMLAMSPLNAHADTNLLMVEEEGCIWCARWHEEISHIYPKTKEGKVAPLKRYDIRGPQPDVKFLKPVFFTPTFILVQNGTEVGRIEGYPGADFFWSLLGMLLKEARVSTP